MYMYVCIIYTMCMRAAYPVARIINARICLQRNHDRFECYECVYMFIEESLWICLLPMHVYVRSGQSYGVLWICRVLYIYIYIYIWIYGILWICGIIYTYIYIYIYIYICTRVHTPTYIHMYIHTHTHTYVCAHIHKQRVTLCG